MLCFDGMRLLRERAMPQADRQPLHTSLLPLSRSPTAAIARPRMRLHHVFEHRLVRWQLR